MIEGLKLKVSAKELREHCAARSSYHTSQADKKEKERPSLEKSFEALKHPANPDHLAMMAKSTGGSYNLDPQNVLDALDSDVRDHRNKSLAFGFMASHFFDEDYTLGDSDLVRLEILKRW